MAHPQQQRFVSTVAALLQPGGPLLEIGSLDVNGSVRGFFDAEPYVGIDLGPGPGVDVVASGHDFGRDGAFATVVTTECLEHDPGWRDTLANSVRVLRPGGTLILTCATTGRHEHGTARTSPSMSPSTTDHYRNLTAADVVGALGDAVTIDLVGICWSSFDLYLVARKGRFDPDARLRRLARGYRLDGVRPSRLADRALLRAWRTDTMGDVPLWAGLAAHPWRAVTLAASIVRKDRG